VLLRKHYSCRREGGSNPTNYNSAAAEEKNKAGQFFWGCDRKEEGTDRGPGRRPEHGTKIRINRSGGDNSAPAAAAAAIVLLPSLSLQ
jgi:hypothetical protein